MQVQVHSIHFDADQKLIDFIKVKLSKLEQIHDKITKSEVFLRIDHANNNENKVTEIKLTVPGKEMFARRQTKSFEESTDTAVDALRRQITKHKEKQRQV